MAWPSPLRQTLEYFDKYDYPLTASELRFWSGARRIGLNPIRSYYFLPGRSKIVKLRQKRGEISVEKWKIAAKVGERLKIFPSIAAVYVTGSLAMNNSRINDDIDLMIVTYPDTLWVTRLLVNSLLGKFRRHPGQKKFSDKICLNLWLDTNNLEIKDRSLYHAHEVLQAKVLWDRGGVHFRFIKRNSWVKNYLPHAYATQNPKPKTQKHKLKVKNNIFFYFFNLIFYLAQLLYMWPKKTNEKVGLGYAFFHPQVRP